MIAPDSSVLVGGFDPAHPFFSEAQAALGEVRRDGRLVAHTLAETLAVLTAGPYAADPTPGSRPLRAPRTGDPLARLW